MALPRIFRRMDGYNLILSYLGPFAPPYPFYYCNSLIYLSHYITHQSYSKNPPVIDVVACTRQYPVIPIIAQRTYETRGLTSHGCSVLSSSADRTIIGPSLCRLPRPHLLNSTVPDRLNGCGTSNPRLYEPGRSISKPWHDRESCVSLSDTCARFALYGDIQF